MKKGTATYQLRHHLTSLLMLVTLLWLTVSTQLQAEKQTIVASAASSDHDDDAADEHSCRALGSNTTEEKTSNGFNTLSEEYLHADNELFHLAGLYLNHTSTHTFVEYVAFHGEMLCPPPNQTA